MDVFEFGGGAWPYTTTLEPQAQQPSDHFGMSVAIRGDTIIAGAEHRWTPTAENGGVFVFFRQGGAWSPGLFATTPTLSVGGHLGASVALHGDIAVAAWPGDGLGGSVLAFRVANNSVTLLGRLQPKLPNPGMFPDLGYDPGLGVSGDLVFGGANSSTVLFSLVAPDASSYCTAKVNSLGCLPSISSLGDASASSAAPFVVTAQSILNNKYGLLFFGISGRTAFPFQGGTLCVLPPIRRTTTQFSGGAPSGSDCSGAFGFDFNGLVRSGVHPDLTPGVTVDSQYWYRDPASASTTGLTDALEFGIGF